MTIGPRTAASIASGDGAASIASGDGAASIASGDGAASIASGDGGTAVRRGRGRRPAAEVRQQILDAAGELLLEAGMSGFTIEKVAARAGASKVTIYKWWPSKGALAIDGYFAVVGATLEFPDTGDIQADLTAQVRSFTRLLRDTSAGRVVAGLIGAAQTDPDLAAAFSERYTVPRRKLAVDVLQRAIDRGELRPDIDPEVVVDQLWGACYNRLLQPDQPLTEAFAQALVHNLVIGLRAR